VPGVVLVVGGVGSPSFCLASASSRCSITSGFRRSWPGRPVDVVDHVGPLQVVADQAQQRKHAGLPDDWLASVRSLQLASVGREDETLTQACLQRNPRQLVASLLAVQRTAASAVKVVVEHVARETLSDVRRIVLGD
jgi:hypothetical protein